MESVRKSINDYYTALIYHLYNHIKSDKYGWTLKIYNSKNTPIDLTSYSSELYNVKLNNCSFPREYKNEIYCKNSNISITFLINKYLSKKTPYSYHSVLSDTIKLKDKLNNKSYYLLNCHKDHFTDTVITLACKTVIITRYQAIKIIISLIDSIETNKTITDRIISDNYNISQYSNT